MTVATVPDPILDSEQLMLEKVDTSKGPTYSVSEMARFFFARTAHWIRWLENREDFVFDGEQIKEARTAAGARRYDLATIEKIAHFLAVVERINGAQLKRTLSLVKIQAEMHGYL